MKKKRELSTSIDFLMGIPMKIFKTYYLQCLVDYRIIQKARIFVHLHIIPHLLKYSTTDIFFLTYRTKS